MHFNVVKLEVQPTFLRGQFRNDNSSNQMAPSGCTPMHKISTPFLNNFSNEFVLQFWLWKIAKVFLCFVRVLDSFFLNKWLQGTFYLNQCTNDNNSDWNERVNNYSKKILSVFLQTNSNIAESLITGNNKNRLIRIRDFAGY